MQEEAQRGTARSTPPSPAVARPAAEVPQPLLLLNPPHPHHPPLLLLLLLLVVVLVVS
jgi:hypothetical protein